jgi:hypothetical protein
MEMDPLDGSNKEIIARGIRMQSGLKFVEMIYGQPIMGRE